MIYIQGKRYPLVRCEYNGAVSGWLLDGVIQQTQPRHTKVRGHVVTEHGVLVVLYRDLRLLYAVLLLAVLVLVYTLWPQQERVYYQVAFAARPLLQEEVLYCNIVNVADREVTVQFLGAFSKTAIYTLKPGETLPYLYIDFVPETIRYNGDSDFSLEVRSD